MKKFVTLLLITLVSAIGMEINANTALATDTLVVKPVLMDSATNSEVDTLAMSVVAPELKWDVVGGKSVTVKPNYLFIPLIFEQYPTNSLVAANDANGAFMSGLNLDVADEWLNKSLEERNSVSKLRFDAMVNRPQDVQYNEKDLPEPPKSKVIKADPSKRSVTIEERTFENVPTAQSEKVKVRNWIHSFSASVQVSQAYLSENWYQGGENNVNVLGDFVWNVKLNPNVYKKLLFENTVQYKVSVNSASQDSIRGYTISQDQFQINTKLGYKAIKNWYYSTNLRFKTQLLNNYKINTRDMKASVLSPADLNIGVGMTYSTALKNSKLKFDLSLSPLSMDMKLCREIKKIDPTSFGIESGKHVKASFGSNVEAKMTWQLSREMIWTSRLFAFTDYENVQGDWENTLNFTINKYLSTRIYVHLRYDNSVDKHDTWKYWQFNEILSFGFNYRFSM